jgi:hypothetical protein
MAPANLASGPLDQLRRRKHHLPPEVRRVSVSTIEFNLDPVGPRVDVSSNDCKLDSVAMILEDSVTRRAPGGCRGAFLPNADSSSRLQSVLRRRRQVVTSAVAYGPHGRVATPVPRPAEYGSSDLFFDSQGRLVAVRLYTESPQGGGPGLMVARYLLTP